MTYSIMANCHVMVDWDRMPIRSLVWFAESVEKDVEKHNKQVEMDKQRMNSTRGR
jgi:hypothetical protein